MRGKVVVFPLRGRNWCFSRSINPVEGSAAQSSNSPSTLKDLYNKLSSSSSSSHYGRMKDESKLEIAIDFVASKMNQSWTNLEKAPEGSLKNRIHGLGLKLLSRVKPSEIFFRSIDKEISGVDVVYPSSLNQRLVHRRLRHLALRGSVMHKKYFYSSALMLPFTTIFTILPLPNIPFFWILFRTYCHWRASQGSEKLLYLMNEPQFTPPELSKQEKLLTNDLDKRSTSTLPYVLQPSKELQGLMQMQLKSWNNGVSEGTVADICKVFYLDPAHVLAYRRSVY